MINISFKILNRDLNFKYNDLSEVDYLCLHPVLNMGKVWGRVE